METYKLFVAVPIILLLASAGYLVIGFLQTGEWFKKNIELSGGTVITVNVEGFIDLESIRGNLEPYEADIRVITSFDRSSLIIRLPAETDYQEILNVLGSSGVDVGDFSVQTIGPALGESFWIQAQIGLLVAFVSIGVIIFIIFRKVAPSITTMLAALTDIVVTLAVMQILDIELSFASLAALMMLIGYSVDTDIMLSSKLLKFREAELGERIKSSLVTGLTMTGTTLAALAAMLITSITPIFSQIAQVLIIGLTVDILTTWVQNLGILRWYLERKGGQL